VYVEEKKILYGIIKSEAEQYLFVGPVNTEIISRSLKREFLNTHHMDLQEEFVIKKMSMDRFLKLLILVYHMLTKQEVTKQEILKEYHPEIDQVIEKLSIIEEAEKYEHNLVHHSYSEEQQWSRAIIACDREKANAIVDGMIPNSGRLSKNSLNHARYMFVTQIAMHTRIVINAGVPPYLAYAKSDELINQMDQCTEEGQVWSLVYQANDIFIRMIENMTEKKKDVSHTMRCKTYVDKNYRKNLTLNQIAGELGLNASYLSHLFTEVEGISIREYINRARVEKAENLLKYSDSSIIEICEYVGFSSQSYFGKIFKKYTDYTPQQYRNRFHVEKFKTIERS
jgi:YesN/AraC family two-component response regulator